MIDRNPKNGQGVQHATDDKSYSGTDGDDLVGMGSCGHHGAGVRLGATDVAALAKFYDAAFGLKQIDHVGEPPTEIIMRYGATVAAAKAGSSPEFLVAHRDSSAANDPITHAVFRVSNLGAAVRSAKAAGATIKSDVAPISIGGMQLKSATVVDPDGNVLELMELPKGASHLRHP